MWRKEGDQGQEVAVIHGSSRHYMLCMLHMHRSIGAAMNEGVYKL